MPTIDDRTSTQSYAKPNVANTLQADVARLRSALDDIDGDMDNALKGGVITSLTDIGASLADGDLFTVYDLSATANRKAAATRITDYTFGKISGDVTVTSAGVAAIAAGVIVNADVNASAAIAGTKISPDFGAQNITTTGSSTAAQFVPTSSTVPTNGLYLPAANTVAIATGNSERVRIDGSGQVGIGGTTVAGRSLSLTKNITGAVNSAAFVSAGTVQSDVTGTARGFRSVAITQATSFTLNQYQHFFAEQGTIGATSTVTNQYGFWADASLTGATNNFGFHSNLAAAAGRWNFYAAGTAENYFASNVKIGGTAAHGTTAGTAILSLFNGTAPVGTLTNGISLYSQSGTFRNIDAAGAVTTLGPNIASTSSILSSSQSAGVGYATGAGGTVTQITSRTTGVTINQVCGSITLVSAAGSTSWQSFTVTNSAVAATDVVLVNQRSGTDLYMIHVTNSAAGSFRISYATTGGTTIEQPVFEFAVIKAVTA